ncbi:MAG: glycosyltransferase [Gammaproteobacteria bacterium]
MQSIPKLIAYPKSGIAYCEELYRTTAELGVEAVAGEWAGRWIFARLKRGDVVHVHWPSFLYYRSGARLATFFYLIRFFALINMIRLRGGRIFWTAHNLYPHDGGRSRWSHRAARRFITRVAEVIFVHGATAAALVASEFGVGPERIQQVAHGHWRSLYTEAPPKQLARHALGLPADVTLYGFVGSCRPYKGLESILAALPHLDESCHLLIAGEFASPQYLRSVQELVPESMAHRVHIVPRFLKSDEIMTHIGALDALVLSYREILTSGAVMLGLSAGVPVVAPNLGGIGDVVNERCGVLYDPHSTRGLADAMREIRKRPYSAEQIVAHALSFDWKIPAAALINAMTRASRPS